MVRGPLVILCQVLDRLVASEKHADYEGGKILWVRPATPAGVPDGEPFLALDTVGAGARETVLVVQEGGASLIAARKRLAPLDAAVVGIVDRVDVGG